MVRTRRLSDLCAGLRMAMYSASLTPHRSTTGSALARLATVDQSYIVAVSKIHERYDRSGAGIVSKATPAFWYIFAASGT
jgi:hypothetical protein